MAEGRAGLCVRTDHTNRRARWSPCCRRILLPAAPVPKQRRAPLPPNAPQFQGPIARLLCSCRHHASAAPKLEAFLRLTGADEWVLAGTTAGGRGAGIALEGSGGAGGCCAVAAGAAGPRWGHGQWKFMLLVLLAVKRLAAGLWRGLLRDWWVRAFRG